MLKGQMLRIGKLILFKISRPIMTVCSPTFWWPNKRLMLRSICDAAKASMGEKEWYFFSLRDRKYPTGLRTNRATEAGYWKTTGKDKEIFRAGILVGMKKTLVFYKGRAPKGEKSNWVMHEYRLENKHPFRTTKVYIYFLILQICFLSLM